MAEKLGPGWAEAAAKAAVKGDTNEHQVMRAVGKRPFGAQFASAATRALHQKRKGADEGHKSRRIDRVLGPVSEDDE